MSFRSPESAPFRPRTSSKRRNVFTTDVMQLLERRNIARSRQDYAESDQLRMELEKRGFIVEDGPEGSRVRPGRGDLPRSRAHQ